MSKCNSCGAELAPGTLFCNMCGNKVTTNSDAVQSVPNFEQPAPGFQQSATNFSQQAPQTPVSYTHLTLPTNIRV